MALANKLMNDFREAPRVYERLLEDMAGYAPSDLMEENMHRKRLVLLAHAREQLEAGKLIAARMLFDFIAKECRGTSEANEAQDELLRMG